MDSRKIDRLVQIKDEIDRLKAEQNQLESEFLLQAKEDLQDTKYKTTSYVSSNGNKVVATTARSLKLTYPLPPSPDFWRCLQGCRYREDNIQAFRSCHSDAGGIVVRRVRRADTERRDPIHTRGRQSQKGSR